MQHLRSHPGRAVTLPLPVWPGWHTMPAPLTIRWSYEAWEGCYGEPWQPHWKPWPHEDEFRERTRREMLDAYQITQPLRDAWAAIAR